MAEYINRDDLLKAAWGKPTLSLSVYDIGNIKPVDVVPVRHARWVYPIGMAWDYVCSECGKPIGVIKHNYCPNCGAKMDLED